MRHYEIVLMFHPDQSEQVPAMVERYTNSVTEAGGKIHRQEDWGRRQMAYAIDDIHKAHYILLNVEASNEVMDELATTFRFNDAILRHMILKTKEAVTEQSPIVPLKAVLNVVNLVLWLQKKPLKRRLKKPLLKKLPTANKETRYVTFFPSP